MIRLLLPLSLVLLAGCASEFSGSDLTKPGVTSTQRMNDTQICMGYAERNRGMGVGAGPRRAAELSERHEELFRQCMMERGYRPI